MINSDDIFSKDYTIGIRGFAALLIIIQHITGTLGVTYFTPLGGIGVSIFLILSGYGLNESYKINKLKNFWKKRFVSVIMPLVIIELIIFILKIIQNNIKVKFMMQPIYWFIPYIIFLYLCFWVSVKFLENKKTRYLFWGIVSLITFLFSEEIVAEQSISFFIGILISDYKLKFYDELILKEKKSIVCLCLLFVLGINMLVLKQLSFIRLLNGELIYYLIQLLIKTPFALLIIIFSNKYCKVVFNNKFTYFVGKMSLLFYLTQMIFIPILKLTNLLSINICIYIVLTFLTSTAIDFTIDFLKRRLV